MKTLIALFFSLFVVLAYSQQQLEFNQVRLVSTQETVPANKVWKLVNVAGTQVIQHDRSFGSSTPNQITPSISSILINGTTINVGNPSIAAGGGSGAGTSAGNSNRTFNTAYTNIPTGFPLWLPENTTLEAGTNISYISVIEFNIQ